MPLVFPPEVLQRARLRGHLISDLDHLGAFVALDTFVPVWKYFFPRGEVHRHKVLSLGGGGCSLRAGRMAPLICPRAAVAGRPCLHLFPGGNVPVAPLAMHVQLRAGEAGVALHRHGCDVVRGDYTHS